MFENKLKSVISIDTDKGAVHFYTADSNGKNSANYFVGSYKATPFSKEFFDHLSGIIAKYRESHPESPLQKVSIVLSDSTVVTDTFNLPIINRRAMDSSLDASLYNFYGSSSVKFNRWLAMQNKQYATYAVTGIKMQSLVKLNNALADQHVGVANVTYQSAAITNAAIMMNPKLKNASFALLDIKDDCTKIILVVKGRTMGFYTLPFGTNVLSLGAIQQEDMLFDHPVAELIVLNAKEKAKAKALTMADDFMSLPLSEEEPEVAQPEEKPVKVENPDEDDFDDEDEAEEIVPEQMVFIGKTRKKTPMKLPKYMQRPIPTDREGIVYENFRVFVKWALEFIASNTSITSLGAPEAVYVNMPDEYSFLYDMVNAEAEDNGILFSPINLGQDKLVRQNLELYGGLYVKQLNGLNNFHSTQLDSIKTKNAANSSQKSDSGKSAAETAKKIWEVIKKIATTEIGGSK